MSRDNIPSIRFELTAKATWKCPHRGCKTVFRSANRDLLSRVATLHDARVHQEKNS
ncbi:hypothetical protein ABT213_29910 [Streptomyces sp. NPDC001674]|uniref:hypothetical protein n=1 Tax=Streptomyces sp. NPDC001674 TaxID=3154394 RepID=UPI00331A9506